MTAMPLVDLTAMHAPMRAELHAALDQILDTSAFAAGPAVELFERRFAELVGVEHVIGVASGTAALALALEAAGIGPGDEVILPPNTFFGTAEAVVAAGAIPVLADVALDTALLDADCVEAALTARTAAVLPVHLYGQPVNGDRFAALAARHGLFLLEDACQAVGASWAGRRVGGLWDAAAFSFYPTKNLGALGDGGAVTTNDAELARRVRLLRSHGEARRHDHEIWGHCERLDGLQAAFLAVKLDHLAAQQRARDAAAARYRGLLARVPSVELLRTDTRAVNVHHLLVVRVPQRDRVLAYLRRHGIAAAVHYPIPIHLQAAALDLGKEGDFPHAEALANSLISLPLWPGIIDDLVVRVVDVVREAIEALP